jgi:hypothetical protein
MSFSTRGLVASWNTPRRKLRDVDSLNLPRGMNETLALSFCPTLSVAGALSVKYVHTFWDVGVSTVESVPSFTVTSAGRPTKTAASFGRFVSVRLPSAQFSSNNTWPSTAGDTQDTSIAPASSLAIQRLRNVIRNSLCLGMIGRFMTHIRFVPA